MKTFVAVSALAAAGTASAHRGHMHHHHHMMHHHHMHR